jgi:hypothetical protein
VVLLERDMTEFKIDKNIPIPKRIYDSEYPYPIDNLNVGDSFFIEERTSTQVSHIISRGNKMLGKRFTSRTMDGGVRIWRIK